MKKIFQRVFVVLAIAALAGYATWSFFYDEEVSTGNTFQAGELDLKVDSECHYNGMKCNAQGIWEAEFEDSAAIPTMVGTECSCTWMEKSLTKNDVFFNYDDVKPGDFGENTISLLVKDNPSWVCASVKNLTNFENRCNEPERKEDETCRTPGPDDEENGEEGNAAALGNRGEGLGELQDHLMVTIWRDTDCDNQLDRAEEEDEAENASTEAEQVLVDSQPINGNNGIWPLFAPTIGDRLPLEGDTKTCIGVYWEIPSETGNVIQSDSISGDISFYAEQARHNNEFTCPRMEEPEPEPEEIPDR